MTRPTASEQLSAWIDGELTDAEAAELEAELARDPSLRAELDSIRRAETRAARNAAAEERLAELKRRMGK